MATIPSLTMRVYLHSFSRCWLPNIRNPAKFGPLLAIAVTLQQPSYLTCLLLPYRQPRVLRSSTSATSTNIAARRFSCCAPTVWNSLPHLYAVDSFTALGLSSRLICLQDVGPLSAPLIPLPARCFARYKFVTDLFSFNSNL